MGQSISLDEWLVGYKYIAVCQRNHPVLFELELFLFMKKRHRTLCERTAGEPQYGVQYPISSNHHLYFPQYIQPLYVNQMLEANLKGCGSGSRYFWLY